MTMYKSIPEVSSKQETEPEGPIMGDFALLKTILVAFYK